MLTSNSSTEFNLINNYIFNNKEYIKSNRLRYNDYFVHYQHDQGIEDHFSAYIKDKTPASSLRYGDLTGYGDLTENWLQLKPSQKESILNQVQSLASHTLSNYNRASCSSFSGQNSSASRQHKPVLDNSIIIKQYGSGTKNLQDVLKCTVSLITKPTANYQDAIRLLNNLTDAGIKPNVITYTAVISACKKGGKAEEALEIFNKMLDAAITPNVITYSAVISACEKGGKAEEALEIFNKMLDAGIKPDVITYNAVISACEKGGKAEEALEIFNKMLDAGITPDVITYSAVISAYEKGGKAEEALEIFNKMPDAGITPDVITYTAVISACAKGGKAEKALEIFNKMPDAAIKPNVITYSAVISACEKGGKAEEALEIFNKMPDAGIKPDVITYTAVISACEKGGKAEEALEIFNKMPDAGITPNVITYNAVISACEKGGKPEKALEIFAKMYIEGLIQELNNNTLNLHRNSFYTYPMKGGDGMSGIHPSVAKVAIQFFMNQNKIPHITVITGFNSGRALKDSILESFKDRVKELPDNLGRLTIYGELV